MSAPAVATATPVRRRARSSPVADALRRYRRNRLAFVSAFLVVLILLVALFAPLLAPYAYDYTDLAQTLHGPTPQHLLGTDELGRDLLSRLIYGARTSMFVGFLVPVIGVVIGMPIGALAGWFGGKIDYVVQRLIEGFTAVPTILLAILLVTLYGSGLANVTLFLGITAWVAFARLTRAQFLALRDREFVTAARAIGTSPGRIMLSHLLPNAAGPIIVVFVLSIPAAVFGEAGLSFLGLGVQDPIPSWGKMITESEQYMQIFPLFTLLPVLCIGLTVLAFSFVGDGLRDALDPNALE
jgi:ABC-type dipeptide/oligopeptide/nickel transport system permease subunit